MRGSNMGYAPKAPGRAKAKIVNDPLIRELLRDPLMKVFPETGSIQTLRSPSGPSLLKEWRPKAVRIHNGYATIKYRGKYLFVHRIIFQAATGQLKSCFEVNHKDGDPLNNKAENLEQVTAATNNCHAFKELGRKRGDIKLSYELAEEIRFKRASGDTYKKLCLDYRVAKSTIMDIIKGKTWKPVAKTS
jgi:hypothetical protein